MMKIKEVCTQTGLTDRTVRYYMECGLLSPANQESYSGRKSYSFTREDVLRLENIKVFRQAGFHIEQIKRFIDSNVSREDIQTRLRELEDEQQTNRQLYEALQKADIAREVSAEELIIILTNNTHTEEQPPIEETAPLHQLLKKASKAIRSLSVLLVLATLGIVAVFFLLGGPNWMQNRHLNGVAMVTMCENGELVSADQYRIGGVSNIKRSDDGYTFDAPYGNLCVNVVYDTIVIEGGFYNTNNWHHPYIQIDISETEQGSIVTQTVTYKTDNDRIQSSCQSETLENGDDVANVHIGLD